MFHCVLFGVLMEKKRKAVVDKENVMYYCLSSLIKAQVVPSQLVA